MKRFLKWLSDLFSSPSKPTEPVIVEAPKKEEQAPKLPSGRKKIAILVGHGAGDSGAIFWNKYQEHLYNKATGEIVVKEVKNHDVRLFFKSKGGWGPTYAQIALWNPDISIEMHCNAASGTAVGCEVLITSESARSLGESFASAFCQKFNRKMRGAKGIKWLRSAKNRGFGNVYAASKIAKKAILVEPFFCDNKDEHVEISAYASFMVEFIEGL